MPASNQARRPASLRILTASLAVATGLIAATASQPARAAEIARLLAERPKAQGLAVPGLVGGPPPAWTAPRPNLMP